MTAGRSILNLYSAWGASRSIHASSLHKLVGTFVLFFDTTPIGRVLNRFSKVRRLPACCKRWAGQQFGAAQGRVQITRTTEPCKPVFQRCREATHPLTSAD